MQLRTKTLGSPSSDRHYSARNETALSCSSCHERRIRGLARSCWQPFFLAPHSFFSQSAGAAFRATLRPTLRPMIHPLPPAARRSVLMLQRKLARYWWSIGTGDKLNHFAGSFQSYNSSSSSSLFNSLYLYHRCRFRVVLVLA